jgi:hypothetical protein
VDVPTCTVAAGKRLAMPAGAMPPVSRFLAMPGGRPRPRFASPGGTTFDLLDDGSCDGIAGTALEMCICNPCPARTICRYGLTSPQPHPSAGDCCRKAVRLVLAALRNRQGFGSAWRIALSGHSGASDQWPLLAQSRHAACTTECPLSAAKRTSQFNGPMSANDSKRTSVVP